MHAAMQNINEDVNNGLMEDVRPTYAENYAMSTDIAKTIGKGRLLVVPVDHGAYEDSRFLRQPMEAAGVNALWYKRGPYTWVGALHEASQMMHNYKQWKKMRKEDCVDQGNLKIFDEYRMILTPGREIEKFAEINGDVDYFGGFEDWMESGESGLALYVLGRHLVQRGIVKASFLITSTDKTGGLADFAARRTKVRKYPTPEAFIYHNKRNTYNYLLGKGLIKDVSLEIKERPQEKHPLTRREAGLVLLSGLLKLGKEDEEESVVNE